MRQTAALVLLGALLPVAVAGNLPSEIVTHPELKVSLFAMEPDVVDPVALCFDAAGRMYVVEMRDYPRGLPPHGGPGGTVRLLEDTNNDGRADRSVLFAEGLSFPTSIAPYRDGVIVAAPPEIVYLKDTNNDGKADVREVLYSGFRLGVSDGNMSGLRWGMDNRLHGVNGGHGGMVTSPRNPGAALRLGNLDFRLHPDAGAIETTFSTGGGFGLVFDQWGRSFTPHNINHMQMRIIESKYLERNPGLPPIPGTESISDHGEMARIHSISEAQTRPNHPEQAGYFSSSGGVGFVGHEEYPGDLPGSVTVCDVVGNLVHRDVLSPKGAILNAGRSPLEQQSEFIASTDIHFRPTGLEPGPDGALYLMDMHRAVIEHPDYIPKKMLESMDLREGDNQGRIYRIIPKKGLTQSQRMLSTMSSSELVEELRSPNQWRRMTAQRLLVENSNTSVVERLRTMATEDASPTARVHALWTLSGLMAIDVETIVGAFSSNHDGVKENALFVARAFIDAQPANHDAMQLVEKLARATDDSSESARVAAIRVKLFGESLSGLAAFVRRHDDQQWAVRMGLSSLRTGHIALALELFSEPVSDGISPETTRLIGTMVGATLQSSAPADFDELAHRLGGAHTPEPVRAAFLDGLDAGLARNANKPFTSPSFADSTRTLAQNARPATLRTLWHIERILGLPESESKKAAIAKAKTGIASDESNEAERIDTIQTLGLATPDDFIPLLLPLFDGQPAAVQRTALDILRGPADLRTANGLLDRWRAIHPSLKHDVVELMLGKRQYHDPLLARLESGHIQVGELNLDLEDRRRLLRWSTADIHERAEKLLSDGEYGNRQAKVDEWLAQLPANGNPDAGRAVFEESCAQCHKVGTLGFDVGPNLTGQSHRSVEDLVSNIIDPNMAIHPNYFSVSAETRDGELHTGILSAETTEAVTLLQARGIRITLNRSDITRLETTGTSMMPEGLEATMTPQLLRDLVEFLRK